MPIYDQSYRRIEGVRKPGRLRFLPIAASALRLFFRRKRFLFLGLAALAPFAIGMFFLSAPHFMPALVDALRDADPQLASQLHVTPQTLYLFLTNGLSFLLMMIFVVFAGGGLIANDLRANALEVYFSRPITRLDYVLGKLLVIMTILLGLTLVPALILWLYDAMLATEEGFLAQQLELLPRLVLACVVATLPFALLMLALSALSRTARAAMISFAAILLILPVMGQILTEALDEERYGLIKLPSAMRRVVAHVLDTDPTLLLGPLEVPLLSVSPWLALGVLGLVSVGSLIILYRRIRPVEIVAG